MSIIRRQLFVGVIDNDVWTSEKLRAYLTKHASTNDDQYVTDCQFMSYSEAKFQGKSFAFVTFTDEVCVDRCMEKRTQFNEEYGITLKRLLPDSISKCERLTSTTEIVVRITSAGNFIDIIKNTFHSILSRFSIHRSKYSFLFRCLWKNR
jgi:hypothetical protein